MYTWYCGREGNEAAVLEFTSLSTELNSDFVNVIEY